MEYGVNSMEELREMLDKATEYFGTDDIVTIMLSQKLDKLEPSSQCISNISLRSFFFLKDTFHDLTLLSSSELIWTCTIKITSQVYTPCNQLDTFYF